MARVKTQFLCNHCGSVHARWIGKCPDCGTWDSLEEFRAPPLDTRADPRGAGAVDAADAARPVALADIDSAAVPRRASGIAEFDRVLGGGIVPAAAVLIGGEPGIGKSTLLLQVAQGLASPNAPAGAAKVLYVTSEESAAQTKLRAARLGAASEHLLVLAETNLQRILHHIHRVAPAVVIVDSVQMIYKSELPAAPGSVTQLRDCCMELVWLAKSSGAAVLFVGHVTKTGTLAGPKIIEHIVDTVVYFEGDRFHAHRIVRCVKNRFGPTHEVGLFEMTGAGLRPVDDPGKLFLEQYGPAGPPSGTVAAAAVQGSRVLLVEVQALTASSVIGSAKRKVSGVSSDRVAMIIAVLEKRCDLRLAAEDVFVSVAGGVKVIEPGIDLAVALAIASAHLNRPLAAGTLAIGELGLGGEVRAVAQLDLRLREAARLGLRSAVIPAQAHAALPGLAVHPVRRLAQAMETI